MTHNSGSNGSYQDLELTPFSINVEVGQCKELKWTMIRLRLSSPSSVNMRGAQQTLRDIFSHRESEIGKITDGVLATDEETARYIVVMAQRRFPGLKSITVLVGPSSDRLRATAKWTENGVEPPPAVP